MEFAAEGPKAIPIWIDGRALLTLGDGLFDVLNPVSGEVGRRIPLCGDHEASLAVNAAREAGRDWSKTGVEVREAIVLALADHLARYAGHFAKLLSEDRAAPEDLLQAEVASAIQTLRNVSSGGSGVLGLVVDSTRPLLGACELIAPALRAGATMVIKPSPRSPACAFALCELALRAGVPRGVLNLVHGDVAAIQGLCAAGVDRILFSGDEVLAKQVGALVLQAGIAFAANQAVSTS